jgi:hypothetical protein
MMNRGFVNVPQTRVWLTGAAATAPRWDKLRGLRSALTQQLDHSAVGLLELLARVH